ncbi:MAG: PilZ domain-containing protein [Myxococcota bacterium]|nr:PilZ domain-containing protein [Myxococcota bacterium]
MSSGTRQADTNSKQKRRDYRVEAVLEIRLRPLAGKEGERPSIDPVANYEELTLAATRFRKELGPAGRSFVDKLMATVDALTGIATEGASGTTWGPRMVTDADLSAGGLGYHSDSAEELGAGVEVEFAVVEASTTVPFRMPARVVRCDSAAEGGFVIGLSFIEVSTVTQRRLVRTVLELQRVQLRGSAD